MDFVLNFFYFIIYDLFLEETKLYKVKKGPTGQYLFLNVELHLSCDERILLIDQVNPPLHVHFHGLPTYTLVAEDLFQ